MILKGPGPRKRASASHGLGHQASYSLTGVMLSLHTEAKILGLRR